jgi:energy-coupling factor transporter ATP-binding protein EcfA2
LPLADLQQLVHFAVDRYKEIPAQLDAYSEFVDSPISKLELQSLESVFEAILSNLSQRFPEIASKRAATNAKNDISNFLAVANQDVEAVKSALISELRSVSSVMISSIAERFIHMNMDERRAIDATLRLIRRSTTEIVFRSEFGKSLASSGEDFERFFAAVKAESPLMRELRFENLVVEKGIFNKLLLKSSSGDYSIWVPSFFAKENADILIERVSLPSEGVLLSQLKELKENRKLGQSERAFLLELIEKSGVMDKGVDIPEEFANYFANIPSARYIAMAPILLDEVVLFLKQEKEEEEERERSLREAEAERRRRELLQEEEEKAKTRKRLELEKQVSVVQQERTQLSTEVAVARREKIEEQAARFAEKDSILLGKTIEMDQFLKVLTRKLQENEIAAAVKFTGDYYLRASTIRRLGVAIVGSSGSGRSTTLRKLLDGLGSLRDSTKVVVVDQKGEHRGIAWKYGWQVFAFAGDSQAKEFSIPILGIVSGSREKEEEDKEDWRSAGAEFLADLIQEWCFETGVSCTDQQRARIASIVRNKFQSGSDLDSVSLSQIASSIIAEPEVTQIGQKISKNLVARPTAAKAFSSSTVFDQLKDVLKQENGQCFLFDLSGRGLKDLTTREEREICSLLLLKFFQNLKLRNSVIVLEDSLDRFKSESLKRKCHEILESLKGGGNSILATSRSQIREFLGSDCLEILQRLSGEKVIRDELAGFRSGLSPRYLENIVSFIPRGYALTSRYDENGRTIPASAVKIEPVQFS